MDYNARLLFNDKEVNLMDPGVVYGRYRNKISVTCKTQTETHSLYVAISLHRQPQCSASLNLPGSDSGVQMTLQLAAIDESLSPIVQYHFTGIIDVDLQHNCKVGASNEEHNGKFLLSVSASPDHSFPLLVAESRPFRLRSKIPSG